MIGMTMRVTSPGMVCGWLIALALLLALGWYLEVRSARMDLMAVAETNADCAAQNATLSTQTSILTLQLQQNVANLGRSIDALSRELEPPWVASEANREGN